MPFCYVGTQPSSPVADAPLNNDIKIFYRTYGGGPTKVLLIIGPSFLLFILFYEFIYLFIPFSCKKVLLILWRLNQRSGLAATHEAWGPQIKGLTGTTVSNDDDDDDVRVVWSGEEVNGGIHVCAFDNRGVGRSSVAVSKSEYS